MNSIGYSPSYYVKLSSKANHTPNKAMLLTHNYSGHPLLTLHSLEQLAERLQLANCGQIKFLAKGIKLDSYFNTLKENVDKLSISDVFRNIERPGSWIALYAVQTDPLYKKLVWDIVNSVQGDWKMKDPGVFFVDGYFFISSAPSVTPFHIDRENNFLLQLAGKKAFGVWHPGDRHVISEEAAEDWIVHSSLSKVKYKEEFLEHAAVHEVLEAGNGIYMPSTAPHMTYAGENLSTPQSPYSITLGVVFYTRRTRKLAYIYTANSLLRKFGLAPATPGKNPMTDMFKYILGKALVLYKKSIRGYSMPPGY